jgi:uncharacterized membrane protein
MKELLLWLVVFACIALIAFGVLVAQNLNWQIGVKLEREDAAPYLLRAYGLIGVGIAGIAASAWGLRKGSRKHAG